MAACQPSRITSPRVEQAIERTFPRLVRIQVSRLGLPLVDGTDLAVTASCRKPSGGGGSGDWVCRLAWRDPQGQPLRDTYDVFVATDGCYTAAVAGESLGGTTLKASNGRAIRNLLYTFEGCFDIT